MSLAYHPLVQRDVSEILRHYDGISPSLGDEFWAELMRLADLVSEKPEEFHFAGRGLRRANMRHFPYHLLFRVKSGSVRVIVVRHNKRHPSYGTGRK
ncbi:MAG TPA: type II toxin-antitoxin system RelE/ParE family toxin [Clostridia bacterium]|nr:type II toxin-antitoxin system RelE/ParE family toxin [Clostridia bacterium]